MGFKVNYNKIRNVCSKVRIVLGTGLLSYGVYSGNAWFLLGLIPLVAGFTKFCPICIISKKCDLPAA